MDRRLPLAHSLILIGPTLLLGGALYLQYFGNLAPCEMCIWQRWPHLGAIVIGLIGLVALAVPRVRRPLIVLAALAVLVSAAIGFYHAGVEQKWWQGPTACTASLTSGADMLKNILAAPIVRCDAIPFSFLGLSLAAWNAVLSTLIAGAALWLSGRR